MMRVSDRIPAQFPFQPDAGVAERLHGDHPRIVKTRSASDWLRIDDVQRKSIGRAGESIAAAKPLHRRVFAARERANLPRSLVSGISDACRHQSTAGATTLSLRGDRQQIQFKAAPAPWMRCEETAGETDDFSIDSGGKCLAFSQNTAHTGRVRVNRGDARLRGDAPDCAGIFWIGEPDFYAH